MNNTNFLTVQEVMKELQVSQTRVVKWINDGYLPAFKDGVGGKHNRFLIHREDLDEFLKLDIFPGHPEDILSDRPFGRIQDLEKCYPVNLIGYITGIKRECDSEDYIPNNIWEYDFKSILECVSRLCDRDRKVIELRYHFGMTLDEVGKAMCRHRETIRQIEAKALRKLRYAIIKEGLYVVPKKELSTALKEREQYKANYERLQRLVDNFGIIETPKKPEVPDYTKIGIEELDLSVRSYNCLKRAGMETVGDMLAYDQHQHDHKIDADGKPWGWHTWMRIRNLGRKSLEEVATKLFAYCGYRIREYDTSLNIYTAFIDIPGVPQTMTKLEELEP